MLFVVLIATGYGGALHADRSEGGGLLLGRADEEGVAFDYVLPEVEEMSTMIEGQEYHLLRLAGFGFTNQVGAPQLPQLRLLVGLPLKGDVEVAILGAEFEERSGYRVAPVPTLFRYTEDGTALSRKEYITDPEIYAADSFYPQRVVEVEKPSFLRNQRVAGVVLRPVQFNPVSGALRLYSKISVGVRFKRGSVEPVGPQRPSRDLFEDVYRRVLINYEAAKRWRRGPSALREEGFLFQDDRDWYKVKVKEDGVYKLDSDDLSEAGIDVASLDPRRVRIFNGGGRELPRDLSASRPDSLTELAISVRGEGDGSFDPGDYVLFYGQALSGWDYDPGEDVYTHYVHHYTDDNIYWLTFGPDGPLGKRMASRDGSLYSPNPLYLQSFRDRTHEEIEFINPAASGLTWFWRTSSGGETDVFRTELEGAVAESLCTVTVRMKGKTRGELWRHEVKIYFNGHLVAHSTFSNENILLVQEEGRGWVVDGENKLRIEHVEQPGSDSSEKDQIYFDWYEIRYWRRFEAQDGELEFFSPRGQKVVEYSLSGFAGNSVVVYDVTDPFNVVVIENLTVGETLRFQDHQDPSFERRYRAVELERAKSPVSIVRVELGDLRASTNGADYLIVTHDDFVPEVEPLRAHRQSYNGFAVKVVKTSAIYDQFSWGLFDPTAIRDFLKYAFDNWHPQPAYVLLVGDGNYDYKNYLLTSPGNWVPPYEQGSETYDDWYVYLDGDKDSDMFVGRLPAQSRRQVQTMVEKVKGYDDEPQLEPWRNRVLLLADDELVHCDEISWNTVHVRDTEKLSRSLPRNFEQIKIYLMDYELDQSCEKPEATEDLLTHLNSGVVLFNYIGHGGYNVMADEHVFRSSKDLPRLRNEGMAFLLTAFTCDVGVFDHPINEGMAEDLVRMEGKGAVAAIAATRGTYSGPNLDLNRRFYDNLFAGGAGFGTTATFGEALVEAKATASSLSNAKLYLLFGDPAQRLGVPRYEVVITQLEPDTLQALRVIALEGETVGTDGNVLEDFDGTALVNVFDSFKEVVHITPDTKTEVPYQLSGAVLFRGIAPVVDGSFRTQFVIPKDITYGGTTGRISLYVSNDNYDGVGYRDSLVTAGGSVWAIDSVGPLIDMTIKGREETFAEGDYVQPGELLKATLFDSSGINITGETGHLIVLQTDGDSRTRVDLTPYFVYDEGSYQKGWVEYELSNLAPGEHTLEIKAWDNHNNASVRSLFLRVATAEDFRILNVMNYPNPLFRETTFTYELTQPANGVIIKIYTVAGRLVKTLSAPGDLGFNQTSWEALDEDGDALANGLYLYKVIASGIGGQRREQIGRLVIMR